MIHAIIFDLDGVLVDAEEWHYDALNKSLGLFGFGVTREQHLSELNGLSTRQKLCRLEVPESIRPFVAEMKQQYTMEIIERECHPDYQKIILLKELAPAYDLMCVSNARAETVYTILSQMKLLDFFLRSHGVLTNEDVRNPKPDPEIYQKAIRALQHFPSECLVIEDNDYGIEAATRAGAEVLRVRCRQVCSTFFIDRGF